MMSWSLRSVQVIASPRESIVKLGVDMRSMKMVQGRSINLALSERGIKALGGVGLDSQVLGELAIPMRARMIHSRGPNVRLQEIPYGDLGQHINSISRRGLNEILLNEATKYRSNITLYFEHDLLEIDATTATASFRNLRSREIKKIQAQFILGCDGAYSASRKELMKHSP